MIKLVNPEVKVCKKQNKKHKGQLICFIRSITFNLNVAKLLLVNKGDVTFLHFKLLRGARKKTEMQKYQEKNKTVLTVVESSVFIKNHLIHSKKLMESF